MSKFLAKLDNVPREISDELHHLKVEHQLIAKAAIAMRKMVGGFEHLLQVDEKTALKEIDDFINFFKVYVEETHHEMEVLLPALCL